MINQLKAKIAAVVRDLTSWRDNVRTNLAEIDRVRADLAAAGAERSALETERAKIESASAIELHRLFPSEDGTGPAQAAVKSDALAQQVTAAISAEQEIQANVSGLVASVRTDLDRIQRALEPLTLDAKLLSQAELVALLSSIVDPANLDVVSNFTIGGAKDFFRQTFVGAIHEHRESKVKLLARQIGGSDRLGREIKPSVSALSEKAEALLALVDEILAEPTPTLARAEAKLPATPNANNSAFIRALASRV